MRCTLRGHGFPQKEFPENFTETITFRGNGLSCLSLSPLIATPLIDFCLAADNLLASPPRVISGN